MSIRILDQDVVAGISAGEVVERPASVVKELVENAVDAGAGRIRVDISSAGMRHIRVTDDGTGMSPSDALMAFRRHATSKLERLNDLDRLGTYGFRGEALAAIASAADVEMRTRTAGEQEGVLISAGPARAPEMKPAGCEKGTDLAVFSLFEKIPARLKFLRSPSAETTSIVRVLEPYVLSHPRIHFQLVIDGEERINAPALTEIARRLPMILGSSANDLIPFSGSKGELAVTGFVQLPGTVNRRGKAWFLVNGRPVEDRSLRHALASSYSSEFPRGSFPSAVVCFTVPPSRIDVNVHPAKTEIRFADPQEVYRLLLTSIKSSFASGLPAPAKAKPAPYDLPAAAAPAGVSHELFSSAAAGGATSQSFAPAREPGRPGEVEILGQYFGTYILARLRGSLLLADQHAAHEKVLYERLCRQSPSGSAQDLLVPQTIEVTPSEAATLGRLKDPLFEAGFEFDSFGKNSFVLRAIPAGISDGDAAGLFFDLIEGLGDTGGAPAEGGLLHRIRASVACHSAVRAGESMGTREMEALITELMALDNPHSCPHGRPACVVLDEQYLAKLFRRPPEPKE